MITLRLVTSTEIDTAMSIIDQAKQHLKEQGIDQWQTGYPDLNCIKKDIEKNKGYFLVENSEILGYLCIDFDGEPAYNHLNGEWLRDENYVVAHRLALADSAREKGISSVAFQLVEELSRAKGIQDFRVDTDSDNQKMQHILKKNGFEYRGTIWFDNSEKIAFEKLI